MASVEIYPCLAYHDPRAMMAFLEKAFGFRLLASYDGPDGDVAHAEMAFEDVIVMLGSAKPDLNWISPMDLPAVNQVVCIALEAVDRHHDRAVAAGAEIIQELNDTDYGARGYGAKDPEGNQWYFSTYRPDRGDSA